MASKQFGRNQSNHHSSDGSGWDQSATTGDTIHNQYQYGERNSNYADALAGVNQRPADPTAF